MRVCMLAYTFYDTDNRVKRYAETLVRRGDEVDVIALRRDDKCRVCVDKGVNIYRIQKRVINEKGRLTYLWRLLTFFLKSSVVLAKNHLRKRYDLIHVHNVPDFEVFAALLPKLSGAKIILDIHDILPEFYSNKFNKDHSSLIYKTLLLIEKLSARFSDHVIISNHLWRETIVSRSVHDSKCTVILNYPDPLIFREQQTHKNNSRFLMLYPGTLNLHQGVDIAIKAFNLVKDELPEGEFHIYGAGAAKQSLINLVSELGLQDRVLFKDFLPLDEIAHAMADADMGIVPKRADSFGDQAFSTKILEFMALGVPVVASSTEVDRYYFDDSMLKFFRSGDERDLADSMLMLMKNQDMRKRLATNALKYIEENNWEVKKHIYFELLDSIMENHQ